METLTRYIALSTKRLKNMQRKVRIVFSLKFVCVIIISLSNGELYALKLCVT
jgi:hypothetical protein